MPLSVTAYSHADTVAIGRQGGATNNEVQRQDLYVRVVPGTEVAGAYATTDGRSRPVDAAPAAVKLPSRLRHVAGSVRDALPAAVQRTLDEQLGPRVTGWARHAFRGTMLRNEHDWRVGTIPLHGHTLPGGFPGSDVLLPRRIVHLFQIGHTPLSLRLPEQVPFDGIVATPAPGFEEAMAHGAASGEDIDPLELLAQNLELVADRQRMRDHTVLFTTPSEVQYTTVYTRPSVDHPWTPRYAGQLDGRNWRPGTTYLGRVVEADLPNITLFARMGHAGETQLPLRERSLVIYAQGQQIPDRRAREGIRTMPIPEDTQIVHLGPSGARLEGSLREVTGLDTFFAMHQRVDEALAATGLPLSQPELTDEELALRYRGALAPDHMDDLQLAGPPAHGRIDPFGPEAIDKGDLAFVAGDRRDLVVAMVREGKRTTLSAVLDELRAAGFQFKEIVIAADRSRPGDRMPAVHHVSDNPVMRPGDEFRL